MSRWIEWVYVALLVWAAVIDIRTHKIKPALVYAMLAAACLKIALEIARTGYLIALWGALMGGAVTGLIFWGMYRLSHGIGLGDVRLMTATGLFYGIREITGIVIPAMLLTALAGLAMVIKDRRNLKAQLPFGPFVATAAFLLEIMVRVNSP